MGRGRHEVSVRSAIHARGFAVEQLPEDISPEKDVARVLDKALESDWSAVVVNFGKDDLNRYQDHTVPPGESWCLWITP